MSTIEYILFGVVYSNWGFVRDSDVAVRVKLVYKVNKYAVVLGFRGAYSILYWLGRTSSHLCKSGK